MDVSQSHSVRAIEEQVQKNKAHMKELRREAQRHRYVI